MAFAIPETDTRVYLSTLADHASNAIGIVPKWINGNLTIGEARELCDWIIKKLSNELERDFKKNRPEIKSTLLAEREWCILGFKEGMPAEELCSKIRQAIFRWLDVNTSFVPGYSFKHEFLVHEEDFMNLKITRSFYCHDYAFYKLNEERAYKYFQFGDYPNEMQTDPLEFFSSWGYEIATHPRPGDLVIYCHNEKLKHVGVWMGNQYVLSKLGPLSGFMHPLRDVYLSYGDKGYILQKSIPTSVLSVFQKDLDRAKEPGFKHPATSSPLSAKGSLYVMRRIMNATTPTFVFKESIYNADYNKHLKEKMLQKMKQISPKDVPDKIDVFKQIQEALYASVAETPPGFNFSHF